MSFNNNKRTTFTSTSLTRRSVPQKDIKKLFCANCSNRGLIAESATHNPRDKNGVVTCPILLKQVCTTCGEQGHLSKSARCSFAVVTEVSSFCRTPAPPIRRLTPSAPRKIIIAPSRPSRTASNPFAMFSNDSSEDEKEEGEIDEVAEKVEEIRQRRLRVDKEIDALIASFEPYPNQTTSSHIPLPLPYGKKKYNINTSWVDMDDESSDGEDLL